LPDEVREKLEAWRREEQKKEEAEYSRLAHELEEYLLDKRGQMPRFHRKPKDDYETKTKYFGPLRAEIQWIYSSVA